MNQFLTTSEILQASLPVARNELEFSRHTLNQYSDDFARAGAKVGASVNARKPPKYRGRYGNAIDVEDIQETPVPVIVDKLFGVDLEYDDVALTLTMDNFQTRYINPVMARIANEIDATGLLLYRDVYNFVGVPNANITTRTSYLKAGVLLDNTATPRRGTGSRNNIISSQMQADLTDNQAALFNVQSTIGEQNDSAQMQKATLGFQNWGMDQNVFTHTVGALGSTPQVTGAGQTGGTINLKTGGGAVTGYFKQGDCFTLASVFGITPNTATKAGGGISTGVLQQFVVTQDFDADANGLLTGVPISPSIITSGAFQTVTASPADSATVLVFTNASTMAGLSSKQALAFHQQAFTRVMVDLPVPSGVDMGGRIKDKESGFAFRLVRDYDIRGNSRPTRVEALWGWNTLYPEWACREISAS
jgi:hypothetical protein